MGPLPRRLLFLIFLLSGFASLIYQMVWTRMAFAAFGVIAPVLSVVLSIFMLGLGVGSWAGGRWIDRLAQKSRLSAAFFYAAAEFLIGLGAFAVPPLFTASQRLLLSAGQMDSFRYLLLSGIALAVSIFPFCLAMGTTFPFMMAYVRERDPQNASSFSFLYLANVLGAMCGAILSAIMMVELLGFRHTLWVAAAGNFAIALASVCLGISQQKRRLPSSAQPAIPTHRTHEKAHDSSPFILAVLFTTGFVSMAMEVVWARGFTATLKTQVYSFALIVFTYLGATFVGSLVYRRNVARSRVWPRITLFATLAIAAFLPAAANDPWFLVQKVTESRIDPLSAIIVLASICPLCALLGYLTPHLVDHISAGDPRRAGSAYAVNVLGCILGPLVACYLLLPHISDRIAMILLGLPLILFWLIESRLKLNLRFLQSAAVIALVLGWSVFISQDFEEMLLRTAPHSIVRRDYMASVASTGTNQGDKHLLVNGIGMTNLTPITKFIAHLPLALHTGPANSVLVICFGMGTSFRSTLSWGIDTTAVELVPSVPKAFGFYHADAARWLADPHGHIIIDDGRRYLSRCDRTFDIILVDPPPPVESAGSSLLFSREFYELAKQHLNPNGIVQMWYPGAIDSTRQAVFRSMRDSFPDVRCFLSVEGWGMHMLGSMQPIVIPPTAQIIAAMPPAARHDLMEWTTSTDPAEYLDRVLRAPFPTASLLNADPAVEVTDDRPYNEYYLLRQLSKR